MVDSSETPTRELEPAQQEVQPSAADSIGSPRAKVMLVLACLVVVINVLHVRAYELISPFDEYAHIDYLVRGSRGQVLVQPDDVLTQEALREVACRGSEFASFPACHSGRYEAGNFVYRGWNQASGHSPWYYVATGIAARPLRALAPGDSLVTWGRVLGAAWLLVGLYLVVRAGELLGVRPLPVLLALVVVIVAPAALHATTTVNPDATGIVGGAAVLLGALSWERHSHSVWALAAGAFFCCSLETTNAIGALLVVFYLLLRALHARRLEGGTMGTTPSWSSYLRATGLVIASSAAAIVGWKVVYSLLSHDVDLSMQPSRAGFDIDGLTLEQVLGRETVFGNFPPIDGHIPSTLDGAAYVVFASTAIFLVLGALLAVLCRFRLADRLSVVGLATVIALLVSPVMLVSYNYVADGVFFHILNRQALSALPALALVVAGVATSRPGRAVVAIVAVGLYLSAAGALLA